MKTCPNCTKEIQDEAFQCPICGHYLAPENSGWGDKWTQYVQKIRRLNPDEQAQALNSMTKEQRSYLIYVLKFQPSGSYRECTQCQLFRSKWAFAGSNNICQMCIDNQKLAADAQIICPHCQTRGMVTVNQVKIKKGISGAKATAAVLTVGWSILATGLSRKEQVTEAKCRNCGSVWHF